MKDAKLGASATEAGREFQVGMVRGKKLNLKELVRAGMRWSLREWWDLVLPVLGLTAGAGTKETKCTDLSSWRREGYREQQWDGEAICQKLFRGKGKQKWRVDCLA